MRPGASLAVLLTASTGCAMTVLDTNVVAVVLPTIARDLGASFADVEWLVSTYVLCFAALLLPAGSIADRLGRRKVFLGGIGLFALASLLCGAAPSAPALYLARGAQGVGTAFLLAPALAIIGHAFHDEAARARAWAIWGGVMGLTMVLAPIIGGVIAYGLGWRWAFYVNVPVCALLGAAVLPLIQESRDSEARSFSVAAKSAGRAGAYSRRATRSAEMRLTVRFSVASLRQAVVVVRQRDRSRRPVSFKFGFERIFVFKPFAATERGFFRRNKQDRRQAVAAAPAESDLSLPQRREYVARELVHEGLLAGGLR